MTGFMYDGAYDAGQVAAAKSRGAIAMSHYLTGPYAATSAQVADIRAAGLGAVLNWEGYAGSLVGISRAEGQAFAKQALAAVDAACPRDGTVGIYFSVDVNLPTSTLGACDEAFKGINDVLHGLFKVKVYGEGAVIDRLVALGLVAGKQWLSASSSYPGYNPSSPNVCLVQQLGSDVPATDRNTVTDPAGIDAWWPDNSPYAQEADMTPTESALLSHIAQIVDRLDFGLDNGGATPFKERGEITDALRALEAKVGVLAVSAGTDVAALATALATELGPNLGAKLVAALGAALAPAASTPTTP